MSDPRAAAEAEVGAIGAPFPATGATRPYPAPGAAPVPGPVAVPNRESEPRTGESPGPTRGPGPLRRNLPLVTVLGLLGATTLAGLPYYLLPVAGRVRHPLHALFKSSGYVGQTAGILAFALFAFIWLYPLRKKYRWLAFTGSIGRWLDLHIMSGLALPLLGAIHAAWRFDGLIGLGYAAMLVVCLSGIAGKYLYCRIPRSKGGLELTIDEAAARRRALLRSIVEATGLDAVRVEESLATDPRPTTGLGPLGTLWRMVADDLQRWRAARLLRRRWRTVGADGAPLDRMALREVLRLARRQMSLTQQVRMLDATHRVFHYWHVAHRPIAITALLAVLIHVAVVVALGATWLG